MEETFNDRFKKVLKSLDLTPTEAGRRMGVSRQVIDSYTKDSVPRYDTLVLILKSFPTVDIKWLIIGSGEGIEKESDGSYSGDKQVMPRLDYELIHKLWLEDRKELTEIRAQNHKLTEMLFQTDNKFREMPDISTKQAYPTSY